MSLFYHDGVWLVCEICGHPKGDHELLGKNVWTCDADGCDEDLRGYCKASRLVSQ